MTRRGIAATISALLLVLALAVAIRGEKRRSPAQAQALLRWVDARRGCIPHSGVVVTTTYLARHAFTTSARIICTRDSHSRIEYLTPPLSGVVALQEVSRVRREGSSDGPPLCPDASCAGSAARHRRHLELLLRNYQPILAGHARTAGRHAYRLILVHRHTGCVARRWWVDAATGLILRSEDYRAEGPLGVRSVYREVRLLVPPADTSPVPPATPCAERAVPPAEEAAFLHQLRLPPLRPRYVPVGYESDGLFHAVCGYPNGTPGAHLQYSDGLRALSIFASRANDRDADEQLVALPLGAMLRIHHRGARFVLIGELGEADLRRMAQSLP